MRTNRIQWLLAAALLFIAGWSVRQGPWPASRLAGGVILLLAFTLVSVARFQLGRSFSIAAKARQLVRTGLYSRIRNPIYLFATLSLIGFALLLQSWRPVVLMPPLAAVQALRARREAAVLQAAFGEEYCRYRDRTWF